MSTQNQYDVGDTVTIWAFSSYDCATAQFTVKQPGGATTVYPDPSSPNTGVAGAPVASTDPPEGALTCTFRVDVAAGWDYLIEGAGPGGTPTATKENSFYVRTPTVPRSIT